MTVEKAYNLLGLPEGSPFEKVVQAKNKLLQGVDSNTERAMDIETAYDILFMQNMKKRLTGELEVSTSVRYADVPAAQSSPRKAAAQQRAASSGPIRTSRPKLPSAPAGLSVAVAAPRDTKLATTQAAIFAGLGVWAIVQAVLESPEVQLGETAGLQLALALGYSIYSMKENKKMSLGKAAGLSFACLVAGALLGTLVESWLRVDVVPLGSFASPGVVVAEFVIVMMAAGAVFLV